MNINEMTIGQFKELSNIFNQRSTKNPYVIGEKYFIRTVTHYFTGILEEVFETELVLSSCAWIADTGRFNEGLRTGFSEVEPYPTDYVIIGRGALIDASPLQIALPNEVK